MTRTLPWRMFTTMAAFALAIAVFGSVSTSAQVTTGSIVGTVSDATGQRVPGAQVTIRNVNRNTTTSLTADAEGTYSALFLVPGTYEVQVNLSGFKSWVRSGLTLQVNDRLRIDATLEVGAIEERTTVIAASPVVRTDSSEVGTVIEETAIKELPLNESFVAGKLDVTLPFLKQQAVEALSKPYQTSDEAMAAIASSIDEYYRDEVIGGPGSFLVVAEGFEAFEAAVRRKIIREIALAPPPGPLVERVVV